MEPGKRRNGMAKDAPEVLLDKAKTTLVSLFKEGMEPAELTRMSDALAGLAASTDELYLGWVQQKKDERARSIEYTMVTRRERVRQIRGWNCYAIIMSPEDDVFIREYMENNPGKVEKLEVRDGTLFCLDAQIVVQVKAKEEDYHG